MADEGRSQGRRGGAGRSQGSGGGRGDGRGDGRRGAAGGRASNAARTSAQGRGRGGGASPDSRRGGSPRSSKQPRPKGAPRTEGRTEQQTRYDGPPLDDSITGQELDRSVRQQLRSLPDRLALRVARHLVAAGRLIDEDPQTAFQHTLAARARASRIAVVREACGEAAYAAGEYAEALAEFRAARRMTGVNDYLPVMADCERALGRPEKALALARNPAVQGLPQDLKAEMTIVESGARRDLGETEAALRTLEGAPLWSRSRADWVARLRYAYADTLLEAGRTADAVVWFHRTAGIDADGVTDASERLAELEGLTVTDTTEDDTNRGSASRSTAADGGPPAEGTEPEA